MTDSDPGDGDHPDQGWLDRFLTTHGGVAGTVHRRRGDGLRLTAASNIPAPVLDVIASVPRGKGMAGVAMDEARPVQTCNLKTDDGAGAVRPGARAVDGQAAVALPVTDDAGEVRAVVGISFGWEGELSDAEAAELTAAASTLAGPGHGGGG